MATRRKYTTTDKIFANHNSKLNSQLPYIHISTFDEEKYPDLCCLLSALSCHLVPDGISLQTSRDLHQAETALRHEKHTWLLNHIVHHELQELLITYEIKSQEVSLSSHDQQFQKILQQCLTNAEIGDYLDFSPDPSSKATVLELTRDELTRQNPHKQQHLPSLQQAVIPDLEERLAKKCEMLVAAHDSEQSTTESAQLVFAKSSQLPGLVEGDRRHLQEEKCGFGDDHGMRHRQFWAYYQTLLGSLWLLETLISQFKLRQLPEKDTIMAEWLYAKCDAMCRKIRLVELQILCDTYTVETRHALHTVRNHLDMAIRDSEQKKQHRQQAILAYESVGDDFDNIVAEFGKLKTELENKQWAITEFKKSQKEPVS